MKTTLIPAVKQFLRRPFNWCGLMCAAVHESIKGPQVILNRMGNLSAMTSAVVFATVLGFGNSVFAGNIWDGGGADDNWNTAANWDTDGTPAYGTATFSGTVRNSPVLDGNYNMNQVNFASGGPWNFSNSGGAVLSLFDNSGGQAKVENNGTTLVTITAPITFAANNASPPNPFGEINAVSADLTFGTSTLTVNGSSVNGIKFFGSGHNVNFNTTVSASGKWFGHTTSGTGNTINIGGSFTSGDFYVMNGGTVNLNSGGTFSTTAVRLGGDFGNTGNQDQTKSGTFNLAATAGTQTFSGVINSVSGNTSGTLAVNSQNTSGANTLSGHIALDSPLKITQSAGGTLNITQAKGGDNTTGNDIKGNTETFTPAATGSIVHSGTIYNSTGSGSVTMNGAGTLTLSGNNTYSGATTISAGALNIQNANALGGTAAGTTVNSGALQVQGGITTAAEPLVIIGDGLSSAGALENVSGNNTFSGNITVGSASSGSNGRIGSDTAGANVLTLAGTVDFQNGAGGVNHTLTVSGAGDTTINGAFINGASGGSQLSKLGAGKLTLTGNNAASAIRVLYNLSGGIISISAANQIGVPPSSVNYPDKFNFLDNSTIQVTANSFTLGRFTSVTDLVGFRIQGGKTGSFDIASGSTLTIDGPIIDVPSSGSSALTKINAGTLQLNQANTYSGGTTIKAGQITISGSSSGTSGPLGPNTSSVNLGDTSGSASATLNDATSASHTHSYPLTIQSGSSGVKTMSYSGTGSFALDGGATLNDSLTFACSSSGSINESGAVTGTGGVMVNSSGSGAVTLSKASSGNTYSGNTTISQGTLKSGSATAIPNGTGKGIVTLNPTSPNTATFDLSGQSQTINGLTSSGTGSSIVDNSSATAKTLTVGTSTANPDGTFSGVIQNSGSSASLALNKDGSGALTLSHANTYGGGTTLTLGTLKAANASALGNGSLALNSGTLDLANDTSINAYNTTVGGATTIQSDKATASSAGITHTLGTLSIGNNQLNITQGANVSGGSPAVTFGATTLIANTAIFDVASGLSLTLGALSGNFNFTKQNSGTMILGSSSSRSSGSSTLTAGTLKLGNAAALGTAGATLALNGGMLDLANDSSVNAYNTTVGGTTTFQSDKATVSSAGITHTLGTLNISAQTLSVAAGANVSSGTAGLTFGSVTATGAAVYDVAGGANLTLGALGGAFSITKQNSGQLTLNTSASRSTSAGSTTLSAGTLRLGALDALNANNTATLTINGGTLSLAVDTGGTFKSANLTINGSTTFQVDRATAGSDPGYTLGTNLIGAQQLNLTAGNNLTANTAYGLNLGTTTFSASGAVFDVANNGSGLGTLTLGALSGNFNFTKQNGGQLTLGTSSSGSRTGGNATLTAGTLYMSSPTGLGTSAATLTLNGGTLDLANGGISAYNTTVGGNSTILSDYSSAHAGVTHTLGTLSIGANTLNVGAGANVNSGTAGLAFGAATLTGAATFSPASGSALTFNSTVDNGGNLMTVQGNGNTTASGIISGNGGLAKSGNGTLTLSVANSYNGNTTISGGTVLVNNSTGSSGTGSGLVSVDSGGTLGGNGSISGAVTIGSGSSGTLAPGSAGNGSIGSLTLGSTLTLGSSGAASMEINKAAGPVYTADKASVTGAITYGGALNVISNANSSAFASGDSFTLFTGSGFSGWFTSVTVPALAAGISWDTNKVATTGVLDIYPFTTTELTISTPKNTAAVITVAKLANHASSGRGTAGATSATTPSHGTAGVSSGVLTYTPTTDYTGSDSFTVTFKDGHGWQTMAVSVTVGNGTGQSPNLLASGTTNGNFYANFAGIPGTTYTVEKTTALESPSWLKLGNYTAPTDNTTYGLGIGVFQVLDPIGNGAGYYRTVSPSY